MPAKDASLASKVAIGLAGAAASYGARKLITFAWTKTTGTKPPEKPEDPTVRLSQAIAWALLVGAGVSVARVLAIRLAATQTDRHLSLPAD